MKPLWITNNPNNGVNNGSVSVIAQPNMGSERTGIITISGGGVTKTVGLTQTILRLLTMTVSFSEEYCAWNPKPLVGVVVRGSIVNYNLRDTSGGGDVTTEITFSYNHPITKVDILGADVECEILNNTLTINLFYIASGQRRVNVYIGDMNETPYAAYVFKVM